MRLHDAKRLVGRAMDDRRGLDELDIENLALGRITRAAMKYAMRQVPKDSLDYEMYLADELNDLLEAARIVFKEEQK